MTRFAAKSLALCVAGAVVAAAAGSTRPAVAAAAVPGPSTYPLLATGLVGLAGALVRRRGRMSARMI